MNLVAKVLGIFGIALLVMGCQSHPPVHEDRAGGPRIQMGLNEGWKFARKDVAGAERVGFDDSTWQKVTLPHTWNNLDGEDGGKNYYRGVGWYRRHLRIDRALAGRSLFLYFDGAGAVADVFVNGQHAGAHRGTSRGFVSM